MDIESTIIIHVFHICEFALVVKFYFCNPKPIFTNTFVVIFRYLQSKEKFALPYTHMFPARAEQGDARPLVSDLFSK